MVHAWWSPHRLRQEVLRELHISHKGQDRTLRRARQVICWPSITNDIRNVVRSCAVCAERLPSHAPEPLLVEPPPYRFRPLPAGRATLSGVHQPLLWLTHSRYLWPNSHIGPGHQPAEGMDVGKRHSSTADNGWLSPVPRRHSKSSVPAGEFVTQSAALTIPRPTEPPRQQSRPSKPFSERRVRMETIKSLR